MRLHAGCSVALYSVLTFVVVATAGPPHDVTSAGTEFEPVSYNWVGNLGTWSLAHNWWPEAVPGQSSAHADRVNIRRGQFHTPPHVVLDVHATVASVRIGDLSELAIAGQTLILTGATPVVNAGTIRLTAGDIPARVLLAGNHEFKFIGGGRLKLSDANASLEGLLGHERLNVMEQTIEGYGKLGNERLTITNRSQIVANEFMRALNITAGSGGLTNNGTLRAVNGGWLRLIDTFIDNRHGVISAAQGSFVEIDGSQIEGGLLTTQGNGVIRNMDQAAQLRSVTLDGRFMLGPTELWIREDIWNAGLIEVVGDLALANPNIPASTIFLVPDYLGDVEMNGSGVLTMLSCEIIAGGPAAPAQLINAAQHTIRGQGTFGRGDLSVRNDGLMVADGNGLLRFDLGFGRTLNNVGTIQTTGQAGAAVLTGAFLNQGTLDVREGSCFALFPGVIASNNSGGMLVGGTWRIEGHDVPAHILLNGANILMNAGDVSLIGPAAQFPRLNSISSNSGILRLLKGHEFPTLGGFFNWMDLTIDSSSAIKVNGTFNNKSAATLDVFVTGQQSKPACVDATGTAVLGGTLRITLAPDAVMPPGTTVTVVRALARNGTFANIIAPPGVTVTYTGNSVVATFNAN